jgi:hypothetical protein
VRFSDEKRFSVWNDGPVRVWRAAGDRYRQGFTRGSAKHIKSVMMWLCITADGRSRLVKCNHRQDSQSYQQTVLRPNLNFIRRAGAGPGQNIVFQQDGASSHTSGSTTRWLAARRVRVLPNWPPNSPDLNPVEHCWAWLAKQLLGRSFPNEASLEGAIQAAWATRPSTLIPALYGSMGRRLNAVRMARGGSTRY